MENVALFGTSADPPTVAHFAILQALSRHYDRVLLWAADNPFKSDQTPLYHRQEMLKVLLNTTSPNLANVALRPELSHRRSLVSVQRAMEFWPEAEMLLIVGSDILPTLGDWYAIDQLIKLVRFLIIPRPGAPIDSSLLENFQAQGGQIETANFVGLNVSSSDFRLRRTSGAVPNGILDYVKRHGLYQTEGMNV